MGDTKMKRDAANRKIVALAASKAPIFAKRERRATLRLVIDVASLKTIREGSRGNERSVDAMAIEAGALTTTGWTVRRERPRCRCGGGVLSSWWGKVGWK